MISGSNEQQQPQIGYTLLKPDCHSWWISKMQSDTLEERYAIKFCFKLGKNTTETYGMLQTAFGPSSVNRASVFEWHKRFKKGRESVRDDERCGRSKEVNRPVLVGQRVWLGLLCWGLREFRKRFRRKRLALFKSGQWHYHRNNAPVHVSILVTDNLTKKGIKTVSSPSLKSRPCSVCYVLTCWPGQKCHSRWYTGRKWHILMAVMRGNRVGGNWLMKWDEVKNIPLYSHRLTYRKRMTSELHDSYFRSMTITQAIPKVAEVTHPGR